MNNIVLMGRLTSDVELKTTPNGNYVCTFNIAVKRPHTSDTTDFLPCVAWRNTAEFISKYFKKGKMIAVSGALTSRKYETDNGNKRTVFEVLVDGVEFCGDKAGDKPADAMQETKEETPTDFITVDDDDLQF